MDSTPVLIVNRNQLNRRWTVPPSDCLVVELSDLELAYLLELIGLGGLAQLKRRAGRIRPMTSAIKAAHPVGHDVFRGSLTQRERQVLALQQRGESNKDIAGILGIGVQTVKNHLHHIRVKTELCGQQVILGTQVSELRERER
jgi:DNA-binding CsgD family transcriptional regulator